MTADMTTTDRLARAVARVAGLVLLALLAALPARAFETRARAALVYDLTTNTVLLEKNADTPLPPASMSKLMTINMLFEALADGRVTLDTRFAVSERVWKRPGPASSGRAGCAATGFPCTGRCSPATKKHLAGRERGWGAGCAGTNAM